MAQRIAYLVAIDHYSDWKLAHLKTPNADLEGLASILGDPAVGGFDEVEFHQNLTCAQARQSIARLFHFRKRYDFLLFYFSGLGLVKADGGLYLAMKDTNVASPLETAVAADYINGWMNRSFSRRQILALDCYFASDGESGSPVVVGAPVGVGSAFRGKGYWRAVISASASSHYVLTGDAVLGSPEESLFTYALSEGLVSGAADKDEDGQVEISELLSHVNGRLAALGAEDRPRLWTYGERADFHVARTSGAKAGRARLKWNLIFGAISAPLITMVLGWERDPAFALEVSLIFLAVYALLYRFGD